MSLTATQLWQTLEGHAAVLVVGTEYRQGYEHLIGMQTWVVSPEILCLCLLNRLNQVLRNQL